MPIDGRGVRRAIEQRLDLCRGCRQTPGGGNRQRHLPCLLLGERASRERREGDAVDLHLDLVRHRLMFHVSHANLDRTARRTRARAGSIHNSVNALPDALRAPSAETKIATITMASATAASVPCGTVGSQEPRYCWRIGARPACGDSLGPVRGRPARSRRASACREQRAPGPVSQAEGQHVERQTRPGWSERCSTHRSVAATPRHRPRRRGKTASVNV